VARRVALGEEDPRLTGQGFLPVLLDAVLARSLTVDEPEQVGRERCVGGAAFEGVDPDRLGLEGDLLDVAPLGGGSDRVRLGRRQVAGDNDVGLARLEPLAELRRLGAVEPEDRGEAGRGRGALRRGLPLPGQLSGKRDEAVLGDRGGQGDGAAAVVDRPPCGRDLRPDHDLLLGLGDEPVVPAELPVRQPRDACRPEDEEEREEQQRPWTAVGPAQHRVSGPG
jgi:hypothetical protein